MTSALVRGRLGCVLAVIFVTAAIALGACGSSAGQGGDPGSADPASNLSAAQAAKALPAGAPAALVALREQANQLIGESEAFAPRLEKLKAAGIPVVVNKWASWCGPCRQEFPDFQAAAIAHGAKLAFIGINSNDGPAAASTFLGEFPVPYPSYSDPDQRLARSLKADVGFPETVFIDSSGEVVNTKIGPYASTAELNADIRKYAN